MGSDTEVQIDSGRERLLSGINKSAKTPDGFGDVYGSKDIDDDNNETRWETKRSYVIGDGNEKNKNTVVNGSVENVESKLGILERESALDGGRLRAGAGGVDVETRTEEVDEPHRNNSGKGLLESIGTDRNRPDVRNDSEGVHRTDGADNAVPAIRENSAEITDNEPKTIETNVKAVEKKRPSNKNNFVVTDDIAAEFDNAVLSAKDNIEAIELLLKIVRKTALSSGYILYTKKQR